MNTNGTAIIDSHVHFWNYKPERDTWMDTMPVLQKDHLPGDLVQVLSQNKMNGCIAVQAEQSEEETFFLTKLAGEHTFIKGVIGWVDLQSNDVEERLEYFSGYNMIKGWRHIVQAEPANFLLRKDFQNGISALAKHHYTFDVLIYPHQMKAALEFIAAFPGQKFVIDHCAKPAIAGKEIKDWALSLKEMAQHPQLYCKLSGLLTEAKWNQWAEEDFQPYLDTVFEVFGCDRIMFGSDWPVVNVAGNYSQWKQLVTNYLLQCSEQEQAAVFGGNAIQFYSLSSFKL